MNKATVIATMAEKMGTTKKEAEAGLTAFIETVEEALVSGDKVQIIGFGTFETRERAAREGKNPKTQEVIQIPASKTAALKIGKDFKSKLNA